MKFQIWEEEESYFQCREKNANQLCSYCATDLRFVFYMQKAGSHDKVHIGVGGFLVVICLDCAVIAFLVDL